MSIIKLRHEKRGEHIHTTVFHAQDDKNFVNTGSLVQRIGEYQEFVAVMLLGADRTNKQIKVITEGWSPIDDFPPSTGVRRR